MTTREILMLGGRAAGKSSVLAAIHDQSRSVTTGTSLQINSDVASFFPLQEKKGKLKDAFLTQDDSVKVSREGDTKVTQYTLEVGKPGAESPEISLVFHDTAGERLNKPDYYKEYQELYKKCRAAILTIDAVELFSGDRGGIPSGQRRNLPDLIHIHLQEWLRHESKQPRLLCIVPTKTETWLRERAGHDHRVGGSELYHRVLKEFSLVFSELASEEVRNNIAVVFTPVQTCGNLIFERYEPAGEAYPDEYFSRARNARKLTNQDAEGYAPLDCDQPLRHILNFFLVQQVAANRAATQASVPLLVRWIAQTLDTTFDTAGSAERWLEKFVNAFHDTFRDPELIKAVEEFSKGIKYDMPFQVIQGKHLLVSARS